MDGWIFGYTKGLRRNCIYLYKKFLNKVETNLLSRNAQIWPSVGIEKSPAPQKCGILNPLNIKFIPNAKIFEKWKKGFLENVQISLSAITEKR